MHEVEAARALLETLGKRFRQMHQDAQHHLCRQQGVRAGAAAVLSHLGGAKAPGAARKALAASRKQAALIEEAAVHQTHRFLGQAEAHELALSYLLDMQKGLEDADANHG